MTQTYVGTKMITAWPQLGGPKIRVCGHDCHPGGEHCNGYCTGKADHAELLEQQPGYAVKYENGHISWSPKDVFEAAYLPIGEVGHLLPHQQRVVAEKVQLDDRLSKLRAFMAREIFKTLPELEQERLSIQVNGMEVYSFALGERIAAFGEAQ